MQLGVFDLEEEEEEQVRGHYMCVALSILLLSALTFFSAMNLPLAFLSPASQAFAAKAHTAKPD